MSPHILWPSQDPQARHSSQVYSVQLWVGHIWGGKGTCQNLKTTSWQVSPPYKQYPRLRGAGQTHQISARGMPQLLWCVSPLHISPNRSSLKSNKGSIAKGPHPQGQDSYRCWWHHPLIGILSKNTYFSFQGMFFEQVKGVAMSFPVSPIVANLYMEHLSKKPLVLLPTP